MMEESSKPCAIVTGSNRGIGAAIARRLAELGYAVVINCRKGTADAASVAEDITENGGLAEVITANVSIPTGARNLVASAVKKLGVPEILVNNVGPYMLKPLLEITPQDWDAMIAGNMNSAFYMIQGVVKHMMENGKGRIINIGYASCHVPSPRPKLEPYCISKTGLYMLTRAFARSLAEHNITVNIVSPGITEASDVIPENIPMDGRPASLDEICDTVEFLVSEKASYITGTNIEVSGGWNII